jgi:hypothetical protein
MSTRVGDRLERARAIADAVLYEGYVLFPYHAAATKNRYRWQFGVLVPQPQVDLGVAERARLRSQVLLRAPEGTTLEGVVRFLHPRRRQVERLAEHGRFVPVEELEVDGELHTTWEEGVEHEHRLGPHHLADLRRSGSTVALHLDETEEVEQLHDADGAVIGRLVRTTEPVDLEITLGAHTLDGEVLRATAEVRNVTDWADPTAERAEIVRHGIAGTHLMLVAAGEFASAIDPPAWAVPFSDDCDNQGTYPVLAGPEGDDQVVLSAPIILHDHPEVADESPGDAYDATEIHELLALCVQGMTDGEKRAARATDPRAAAVVDGADHLPPEIQARLHGVIRDLGPATGPRITPPAGRGDADGPAAERGGLRLNEPAASHPLEEELAEFLGAGESPLQRARLDGTEVVVGDRVRLRPVRRADAQDVFVTDRVARIGKIVQTLEGEVQVAVILEDDPGADVHEWYGRYLYFHLDEIVPVDRKQEDETP